jgi:4-amino-4-deoxy-L-arabinose transferase-like glycosyltransferase
MNGGTIAIFVGAVIAGIWLLGFTWLTLGEALLGLAIVTLIVVPFVLLFWAAKQEFSDEQREEDE